MSVAFDTDTFTQFSKLSGLAPRVSMIHGRTFAGNTALVACGEVVIATERTTVAIGDSRRPDATFTFRVEP